MGAVEERVELVYNIICGKLSKRQAEQEIERLEKTYGEDAFTYFTFEKWPKPWNEKYLKELETLSMAGAGSKEFILHLAEVKKEIKYSGIRKLVAVIAVVALGVLAILLFLQFLGRNSRHVEAAYLLKIPFATKQLLLLILS